MLLLLLLVPAGPNRASAEGITLTAGAHERRGGLIRFEAPPAWRGRVMTLHGSGQPLQVDDSGQAAFLLTEPLAKGASRSWTTAPALPLHAATGVETVADFEALRAVAKPYSIAPGKSKLPLLTYQMQPGPVPPATSPGFAHGAHLHPVFSPSGKLVTANHPPDHPHQRGIWFAWTHTEFEGRKPDFWNMGKDKSGRLTGEVRFDKLLKHWSGPVHGGFVSAHRWIDHTGGAEKDMLHETWEVCIHHTVGLNDPRGRPLPPRFVIDLTSTQTCAAESPVKLPKYHYGGLGVRGSALWDPPDRVRMLTSNGDDRVRGDATKAKWVWLGGELDGGTTGITVLIHPSNFRFPQPLRLNPKNPQLSVAPSADGDWVIKPGESYVSRYRIVVSDGAPDAVEIERLWSDYAEPPTVELH